MFNLFPDSREEPGQAGRVAVAKGNNGRKKERNEALPVTRTSGVKVEEHHPFKRSIGLYKTSLVSLLE